MATAKVAKRGGATKIRTVRINATTYGHVYVVRKKGPRGGRTVMGEIKRKKRVSK